METEERRRSGGSRRASNKGSSVVVVVLVIYVSGVVYVSCVFAALGQTNVFSDVPQLVCVVAQRLSEHLGVSVLSLCV